MTKEFSYHDPLDFLPRKRVENVAAGRLIYGGEEPPKDLYVVILGVVKVGATTTDCGHAVSRLVGVEGLFGDSCMVGSEGRMELASALTDVALMAWSRDEIELQIEREPLLGMALAQYMVRECQALKDRIESVAIHKTPQRVVLALLQLAAALGTQTSDGATRVAPLTHQTIAEFVGTSREIVTCEMNRLRRLGLCRYSRKFIDVYAPAMREYLAEGRVNIPQGGDVIAPRRSLAART